MADSCASRICPSLPTMSFTALSRFALFERQSVVGISVWEAVFAYSAANLVNTLVIETPVTEHAVLNSALQDIRNVPFCLAVRQCAVLTQ